MIIIDGEKKFIGVIRLQKSQQCQRETDANSLIFIHRVAIFIYEIYSIIKSYLLQILGAKNFADCEFLQNIH